MSPDDEQPAGAGGGAAATPSPGGRKRGKSAEDRRRERLAAQLRTNLQRRKEQVRSRRAGEADERPAGLGGDESE